MTPLTILKENRKTITLKINEDLSIIIKAPKSCSDKAIKHFITSKDKWITKTKQAILNSPHLIKLPFNIGDKLFYLGKSYIIKSHSNHTKKQILHTNDCISFQISNPLHPHKEITNQLKQTAKEILLDRMHNLSNKVKLFPKKTVIKSLKSRWGSCSSLKNINLNWKLIHAPISVIDYVIIHELCHLVHMNHSRHFWQLVKQYDPIYKDNMNWLKKNGNFIKLTY